MKVEVNMVMHYSLQPNFSSIFSSKSLNNIVHLNWILQFSYYSILYIPMDKVKKYKKYKFVYKMAYSNVITIMHITPPISCYILTYFHWALNITKQMVKLQMNMIRHHQIHIFFVQMLH